MSDPEMLDTMLKNAGVKEDFKSFSAGGPVFVPGGRADDPVLRI